MSTLKILGFLFLTSFLTLLGLEDSWAVRPLYANLTLVAGGEGHSGFKDGSFTTALFNNPLGLAVSDDGNSLFVADSGNNRIRVVHLDQDNEVTTLAGQDAAGKLDGPVTVAQFIHPCSVLILPGDRLAVNDSGNQLFRLVDAKTGSVTTLAGAAAAKGEMRGVRDMIYMKSTDSIFYTQPDSGSLKRLDMKTGLVSTVLEKNIQLPTPAALWCDENKLYVADRDLPQVYELDWKDNAPSKPLLVASTLGKVISMAENGSILYTTLANPGVPIQRFFLNGLDLENEFKSGLNKQFDKQLLTYRSPWGDSVPQTYLFPPRGEASFAPSTGFAPDPGDIRKLYLCKPDYSMIISFRDLFGSEWNPSPGERNSIGVGGPEYPAKKPKNTYRIIIEGDSRSAEVQNYTFETDFHFKMKPNNNFYNPSNLSLAPQTERELNFQAALDGSSWNYEVFNFSKHGDYLTYPVYGLPDMVKRDDIDLVILFMTDHFPPESYFDHPLDSDGIPKYPNDVEFQLKPVLQRLPTGPARKFYDFCKAHGLVTVRGNGLDFNLSVINEPEIHDTLLELYGKPYDIINKKLAAMRTSSGQPVRLILCNTYTGRSWDKQFDSALWREVAKKYNFTIWDMNDEMNALSLSYYPLTGDPSHLNPDGGSFFGRLFAHDLIRDKMIPFKTKNLGE